MKYFLLFLSLFDLGSSSWSIKFIEYFTSSKVKSLSFFKSLYFLYISIPGGVQIDGQANINLVGTGSYPKIEKRYQKK